jgi:hypothetical protein
MNILARPITAEEFVRKIESSQSVEQRSIGSNLTYRPTLIDGADFDTVTRGLLTLVPSYFDISRVTRGGKAIVSTRSHSIKKNLAKCVVPELNSHAFEKEMKALESCGEVKHIIGRVEKINEVLGTIKYHKVNIYAKSSAPDIAIPTHRPRTTSRRHSDTMINRIYNILPDCLSSNQRVGTSKWCAEQLGIDIRDRSAYSAVRTALFSMAHSDIIKSRLSNISRGENRRNPRIYWK